MVTLYVLNVPEFAALLTIAADMRDCSVSDLGNGYSRIDCASDLVLNRKQLKFKPAVWYCALSGGFRGRVAEFGRDELRLTSV